MRSLDSFIFRALARLAFFLVNALAFYLLLRGHNLPGGGFIAGLATAISLVLLSMAIGIEALHQLLRVEPLRVAIIGLGVAVFTGLAPVVAGHALLEHFHLHLSGVPLLGEVHVGTPLLFDVGVYLVVLGVASKIIFVLSKSTQRLPALVAEDEQRYSACIEEPIESAPPPEGARPGAVERSRFDDD